MSEEPKFDGVFDDPYFYTEPVRSFVQKFIDLDPDKINLSELRTKKGRKQLIRYLLPIAVEPRQLLFSFPIIETLRNLDLDLQKIGRQRNWKQALEIRIFHKFVVDTATALRGIRERRISEIKELRVMVYKDYLHTPYWESFRRVRLEEANFKCRLCNSSKSLNVHHRTYERLGQELPEDVLVLCNPCHAKHHNKLPNP